MFLEKGVLKICDKFTGEIPMPKCDFNKVASNFIEILVRHGCSAVSLLHIFRTLFPKNTSGQLLLKFFLLYFYWLIFPKQLLEAGFTICIHNSKSSLMYSINCVKTPIMRHSYWRKTVKMWTEYQTWKLCWCWFQAISQERYCEWHFYLY